MKLVITAIDLPVYPGNVCMNADCRKYHIVNDYKLLGSRKLLRIQSNQPNSREMHISSQVSL